MGRFFISRFKIILRNRALLFWTLIFPIALATFFQLAFSNLSQAEKFEVVPIAIVKNASYQENQTFRSMIEAISKEDENQIFAVTYTDEAKAKELLDDQKIDGYLTLDDKIELHVLKDGLQQTIIKSVIDQYYQLNSTATNIILQNPNSLKEGLIEHLFQETEYLQEQKQSNMDYTVIYFYTLIGMACLYGGFFGVYAVNETEANLSKKGARLAVSPTKKWQVLLSSFIIALLVQFASILLLLTYLNFILKVSFGSQLGYILLLSFMGCMAGVSLGVLIGSLSKKSVNLKTGILITVTMLFSFLAGMMVIDIRYMIATKLPLLGMINPVNLITDGLYSLYYYTSYDRYFTNLFLLLLFTLVTCLISYFCMRRKQYDSI